MKTKESKVMFWQFPFHSMVLRILHSNREVPDEPEPEAVKHHVPLGKPKWGMSASADVESYCSRSEAISVGNHEAMMTSVVMYVTC